jgi:hypothetical protein
MRIPPYAIRLVEELSSSIDDAPEAVDIVQLAQPDLRTVHNRLEDLIGRVAKLANVEHARPEVETQKVRTTMSVPGGLRANAFHASGAMSVTSPLAPFDALFETDPGDDELVALSQRTAEELGLQKLVPDEDSLSFERLWRIKAAGGDEAGTTTEPVLCRVIGAFRHHVRELPVYGRASCTVELAAGGQLASASVSLRRFAGDEGGKTVARAKVRTPEAAAHEVAARVVATFGGRQDMNSSRLVAEWFRFGYLSFGRRRTQALLAPFYVASVAIDHEYEASAHVIAVPASEDQYIPLPPGRRASAPRRHAVAA